jgi:hypothetical protein
MMITARTLGVLGNHKHLMTKDSALPLVISTAIFRYIDLIGLPNLAILLLCIWSYAGMDSSASAVAALSSSICSFALVTFTLCQLTSWLYTRNMGTYNWAIFQFKILFASK